MQFCDEFSVGGVNMKNEPRHDKTSNVVGGPARTQISLGGIRPV